MQVGMLDGRVMPFSKAGVAERGPLGFQSTANKGPNMH